MPDQRPGSSRKALIVIAIVSVVLLAAIGTVVFVLIRNGQNNSDNKSASPARSSTSARSSTTKSSTSSSTASTSTPSSGPAGAAGATATIDGNTTTFSGQPSCVDLGGTLNLTGGDEGTNGYAAILSISESLEVETVGIFIGGSPLTFAKGAIGDAQATKDGNTYTISGHGMGIPDFSNPSLTTKPFEIKVTCP